MIFDSKMHHLSFFLQGELLHAEEECLLFPKRSQVIQAAIVLIKEKNGKFQTFRVSATNIPQMFLKHNAET